MPIDPRDPESNPEEAIEGPSDPCQGLTPESAEPSAMTELVERLSSQVNELTGQVNALTGQVNELTGARNVLTGQVNDLTGERNALVGQVNELTGNLAGLSVTVEDLQGRNERMSRELSEGAGADAVLGLIAERISNFEQRASRGEDIERPLGELSVLPPVDRHLPPLDEANINRRIGSLPFAMGEAVTLLGLSRVINQRLREGFYRDRLLLLVTQEKSSSTLHEVALNHMLHLSGRQKIIIPLRRQAKTGPTSMAGSATFHHGMLLYFPNGGVCRGVFHPTRENRLFMSEIDCRKIILFRHPADRIVAQFCMRAHSFGEIGLDEVFDRVFADRDLTLHVDPLLTSLSLMEGWLRVSNEPRVKIARYEDMMASLMEHFAGIHAFLYGRPMSAELETAILEAHSQSGEGGALQSGESALRTYPKGYSGKVGVWRDYLTRANVQTYNEVVSRFLEFSRCSDRLLALYPDLLLDPAELSN